MSSAWRRHYVCGPLNGLRTPPFTVESVKKRDKIEQYPYVCHTEYIKMQTRTSTYRQYKQNITHDTFFINAYMESMFRLVEKVQKRKTLRTKGKPILLCAELRRGRVQVRLEPSERPVDDSSQGQTKNKKDYVILWVIDLCCDFSSV